MVTVPSILSFDKNAAEKKLKEAGLVPEYLGEDDSVNEYGQGQVSYQSISAGTQVEKGTTVQYRVSKGAQPSAPDSGIPEMIRNRREHESMITESKYMQGKIIKIAGFYYVNVVESGIFECKAKGAFRKDGIKPLVGDDAVIEVLDEKRNDRKYHRDPAA